MQPKLPEVTGDCGRDIPGNLPAQGSVPVTLQVNVWLIQKEGIEANETREIPGTTLVKALRDVLESRSMDLYSTKDGENPSPVCVWGQGALQG